MAPPFKAIFLSLGVMLVGCTSPPQQFTKGYSLPVDTTSSQISVSRLKEGFRRFLTRNSADKLLPDASILEGEIWLSQQRNGMFMCLRVGDVWFFVDDLATKNRIVAVATFAWSSEGASFGTQTVLRCEFTVDEDGELREGGYEVKRESVGV